VALFAIPFCLAVKGQVHYLLSEWTLFTIGASLTLANYVFLGLSYKEGNISTVYPVSRAGALIFLPVLSLLLLEERISLIGLIALGMIIAGCFIIQLRAFRRQELAASLTDARKPSTIFAGVSAFTVACYSLWDKRSVHRLDPFLYFYSYTTIIAIAYALVILTREKAMDIARELSTNWPSILQVGLFNTLTYLLVLLSLGEGKATYVIALRQLSIPVGAFLGYYFLKEPASPPKQLGIAVIVAGCLLVCLAK
jgi:uncharacterized membrane protein